jgi:penicillin-binding protein 2
VTLQPESNKQLFYQRLNMLSLPILLVFIAMGARLWQLQIIRGSEFALKAEQNRVRTIQVVAPRGTIVDRFNNTLVENRPSFNILLYRESVKDFAGTSDFIIEKLKVRPDDLTARLRRNKASGLYRPIVIKEDVGIDDISIIEAHRRDHPELQLGPVPRRLYRYGKNAAHLLGYVGEVSEDELANNVFPGCRTGDLVGKSGLERMYNKCLPGEDGKRQVLVDSLGREVGLLEEQDSIVGGEVQVTLELELQTVAENLLQGKVGVIAAMDPRNGEILVMASSPSFDPNNFSTRISEEDWNLLVNDPDRPLQNRAIQNSYSPGSIFKLIMAEAALEEGLVPDGTRVFCSGAAVFYNRLFHCASKTGHGYLGLEGAITHSCNIFFYEMGRRMGISRIAQHAHALGLGERTGIDLPGERSGVMPSPEWKLQSRGSKWFAGETISVAIGQGAVSTTPLQILRAASAIAMDGKLATPHVLLRADKPLDNPPVWETHQLPVEHESLQRIREGMWGSVNSYGTGHNASLPGLDICGKTGTVQVISNEGKKEIKRTDEDLEDHSWFVGFANKDNPEIAVVVFIEHGGKGGIAAAPIAREIFRAYFARKPRTDMLTQARTPTESGWR